MRWRALPVHYWTGTVHLSRRYGLINQAVFKGEKEESRRNIKKKKRTRSLWRKRVSLSRFRWSHGDSQHVYSAVIINRLLYAALSRERKRLFFFLTVTRFSLGRYRRRKGRSKRGKREGGNLSEHSADTLHLLASLCPGSYAALPRPLFILRGCLPGYVPWYASVGGPPRATCQFKAEK